MVSRFIENDVRQLFAYSVLSRLDRLEEANVGFTFQGDDLYLSVFAEAFERLDENVFRESDPELLQYAQVFERFATTRQAGVNPRSAATYAAAFYWLAGYSANARVLARRLAEGAAANASLEALLVRVLNRTAFDAPRRSAPSVRHLLHRYIVSGDGQALEDALEWTAAQTTHQLIDGDADEYVSGQLLHAVLRRLRSVSLWGSIGGRASAPRATWEKYARLQLGRDAPVVDLWPSQRAAIRKGLLDGRSTVVLRMPTSAGKTKMSELALLNDLFTDERRCLFLAPYRALVSEVEHSIGRTISDMGIGIASLYGGSDANEIEVALAERARVTIATPEKIAAVLKVSGGTLHEFGTIVLDEGHLLDSRSRGVSYELQIASLLARTNKSPEERPPRIVFLSAVLPNAEEIAEWLGGSVENLASDGWQPTAVRVATLTWPAGRAATLRYVPSQESERLDFFVPRVIEEDVWKERSAETGRQRTYRFPARGSSSSIAAALGFRYATYGPVLVFANRPAWAESVAQQILNRIDSPRPIDAHLVDDRNRAALREIAEFVSHRLGSESLLARSVARGFAFHHGTVPHSIRLLIEDAFRTRTLRLMIATTTVAQGVNFPAKTIIVHSMPTGDAPVRDFWNLVGRAGRAMKETDGEVIVLQTGQANPERLREFLDRGYMEDAESQILQLVRAILEVYPAVDAAAVDAVLASSEGDWQGVVRTVDTYLLEVMAEDLEVVEGSAVDALAAHLLATQQARRHSPGVEAAIQQLFRIRATQILERIPSARVRRWYARTGVSADGARILDDQLSQIAEVAQRFGDISEEALRETFDLVVRTPELEGVDPGFAARMAVTWLQAGRYSTVFDAGQEQFGTLDKAVSYIEGTLGYRLPWVLNGAVRLLESRADDEGVEAEIPPWFRYLPQYLHYGVRTPPMLWVMSLGVGDPPFAEWLLERYHDDRKQEPRSFTDFLTWALRRQEPLCDACADAWPRYFERLLRDILDRYRAMRDLLRSEE